jgi:hypothetical protein
MPDDVVLVTPRGLSTTRAVRWRLRQPSPRGAVRLDSGCLDAGSRRRSLPCRPSSRATGPARAPGSVLLRVLDLLDLRGGADHPRTGRYVRIGRLRRPDLRPDRALQPLAGARRAPSRIETVSRSLPSRESKEHRRAGSSPSRRRSAVIGDELERSSSILTSSSARTSRSDSLAVRARVAVGRRGAGPALPGHRCLRVGETVRRDGCAIGVR